jgi:cyclin-dependent kinase 8/11
VKLNREISHENVVALKEVILEDKSIYMVFEYAEHDFLVRFVDALPRLARTS